MYKFIILFAQPKDLQTFEDAYNDLLALIERMPHILRRQVNNIVGGPSGPSDYYRVLEVYFENRETMQQALMSSPGQEAGGEMRRFPDGSFTMMFAEVYEEQGGHTPKQEGTSDGGT